MGTCSRAALAGIQEIGQAELYTKYSKHQIPRILLTSTISTIYYTLKTAACL